ncbi:MAG: sigma-54 dependent transcriptional regulator [Fibrobacterales bacterium]
MKEFRQKILLVDDEAGFLETAVLTLQSYGFSQVDTLVDSRDVIAFLRTNPVDIVSLDLTMPYISGEELLQQISDEFPHISVIIISGIMDVETVITCMRLGAKDYIMKPLDDKRLSTTIANIAGEHQLRDENRLIQNKVLSSVVENGSAFNEIVTGSPLMQNLFSYAEAIAVSPLPVLITGDTGTGKELMARALHKVRHPDAPFVACNVAGIDDSVFSDTLFGHVKGGFTGADSNREGVIEQANGGTLFLDEIGELSPESQVKLLRLLQEDEYQPIGADRLKRSKAWVVLATNRDLESLPQFRKDLYYRLAAHRLHVPPLSERVEDIPPLIQHFIRKYDKTIQDEQLVTLSREVERDVLDKPLNGNIRELEGIVANRVISGNGAYIFTPGGGEQSNDSVAFNFSAFPTMSEIRVTAVREAIDYCNGNKTSAARLLGVSKQTVFTVVKESIN